MHPASARISACAMGLPPCPHAYPCPHQICSSGLGEPLEQI